MIFFTDTFLKKDGSAVRFADYFQQRYNLKCTDMNQPMLISMPKEKDRRGGRPEPVSLVPEFCTVTGQDDEMRGNFKLQNVPTPI
jgi:hypothetical protein